MPNRPSRLYFHLQRLPYRQCIRHYALSDIVMPEACRVGTGLYGGSRCAGLHMLRTRRCPNDDKAED